MIVIETRGVPSSAVVSYPSVFAHVSEVAYACNGPRRLDVRNALVDECNGSSVTASAEKSSGEDMQRMCILILLSLAAAAALQPPASLNRRAVLSGAAAAVLTGVPASSRCGLTPK